MSSSSLSFGQIVLRLCFGYGESTVVEIELAMPVAGTS
jgi:hypothetical protein